MVYCVYWCGGQGTAASPGNLEQPILRILPRPTTASDILGVGQAICVLTSPPHVSTQAKV